MARKPAVSADPDAAAKSTKLFVLDTNVLMHDPTSVYRFEEHDVFLPIMTLEELDDHKKGMSEIARNARQVTRTLDAIVNSVEDAIDQGIALYGPSRQLASGRLFLQTEAIAASCRRACQRPRSTTRFSPSSSTSSAGIRSVR
jgi:PhoH-like ATPase